MMLANSVFYLLKGTARLRVWVSGFSIWSIVLRVQGSTFRVPGLGSGFRLKGLGFRDWGSGFRMCKVNTLS